MMYAPPQRQAETFGMRGQAVLTGGFGYFSSNDYGTTLSLYPAMDYFITDRFSLGGGASLTHSAPKSYESSTRIGLEIRFGYNVPTGERTSLWMHLTNGFDHVMDGGSVATTTVRLPLLFHVATHFFFAVGPELRLYRFLGDDAPDDLESDLGASSFIGGWW